MLEQPVVFQLLVEPDQSSMVWFTNCP